MAIIDRIRFDAPSEEMLVWRYSGDPLRLGSQLVVNQSQDAVFVKKGEALDVFGPGTHILSTGNLPLLHRLVNLPFGGDTPFTAEVWFVNKTVKRGLKWGTKAPIPIIDSVYNYPVNVRAYGRWGLRITDSRSFVTQMVGILKMADTARIEEYFIGEIDQKFSDALSEFFESEKSSVFQANAQLNELSTFTGSAISREFGRYGIEIVNFNIERISIPKEEMDKFQELLGKRNQVGQSPQRPSGERSKPEASDETDTLVAKLKALKKMLEDDLITNEEYEAKKKEILEKF
ncbi:MAG: SPFH domain-containing protein [candidate division WOR-3 bacterium]|nr:SPFH domain-containing protein [candidate division WOR-3 bacterium]